MKYSKIVKLIPAAIRARVKKTPLWVHFYVTRRCNLDCEYCFVREFGKDELSTEEVFQVIDKLYSLGIRAIAFFGGEPTLRKDFCDILRYANEKGMFTFFTTNGVLLTEEYIERIAKTGVDFIELSVDSIFDFDESKKSYTKSKKVFDLLLAAREKYHFDLKTHMVLTKPSISNIIDTIKTIQKYDVPLTVGYVIRNTYNDKPDNENLFFNDEASKQTLFNTIDEIIELKKQGSNIMDPFEYFSGMKDYVNGKKDWGCMAGRYSFSVDSDGTVQLCAGLQPYPISVMDIDKDFFKHKKDEIKSIVNNCMKKCYSNCHKTTAYVIEHPIQALLFEH